MSTETATQTQTYRWTAKGFTDDITTCERCGKPELKGTVRMVAVDADGDEGDILFMGVVCAARMTGRKAEEIRHEAKAADAAADAERRRIAEKRTDAICALRDQWLAERGLNLHRCGFEKVSEALNWAKSQLDG